MKNDDKLQIYVYYPDGSIQGYGYDGKWFETIEAMLDNVLGDFPEVQENIDKMLFVWGTGLPLGDELKDKPTKTLDPVFGDELIEALTAWLKKVGVIET